MSWEISPVGSSGVVSLSGLLRIPLGARTLVYEAAPQVDPGFLVFTGKGAVTNGAAYIILVPEPFLRVEGCQVCLWGEFSEADC